MLQNASTGFRPQLYGYSYYGLASGQALHGYVLR